MLLTFAAGGVASSAAGVRGGWRSAREGAGEEIGGCPRNPPVRLAGNRVLCPPKPVGGRGWGGRK